MIFFNSWDFSWTFACERIQLSRWVRVLWWNWTTDCLSVCLFVWAWFCFLSSQQQELTGLTGRVVLGTLQSSSVRWAHQCDLWSWCCFYGLSVFVLWLSCRTKATLCSWWMDLFLWRLEWLKSPSGNHIVLVYYFISLRAGWTSVCLLRVVEQLRSWTWSWRIACWRSVMGWYR